MVGTPNALIEINDSRAARQTFDHGLAANLHELLSAAPNGFCLRVI
jgi:hypothetical protein